MDFEGGASDLVLQDQLRVHGDTFLPARPWLSGFSSVLWSVHRMFIYLSESEWGGRGRGGRLGEGITRKPGTWPREL